MAKHHNSPIGIFDSGYGGLTIFKSICHKLPQYNYIYLGDNARAPYGNRSYETVYQYTLQCLKFFFDAGCPLVILACNTASAKALRTIQQNNLQEFEGYKRVLGVIRPTAEVIGNYTKSGNVGIMATQGTVQSLSYEIEIRKFFPQLNIYQQACPMWVPLIENNEYNSPGADYFIRKYADELIAQNPAIDAVLLACTHYPIIADKLKQYLPDNVNVISQGEIVANSLADYLIRHPEMQTLLGKEATRHFYTTDDENDFQKHATLFFGQELIAESVVLE